MSDPLGKKTSRQTIELTSRGNSSVDLALWRLSLILREIAENLASDAGKETRPRHAPATEGLTNSEEAVPHE